MNINLNTDNRLLNIEQDNPVIVNHTGNHKDNEAAFNPAKTQSATIDTLKSIPSKINSQMMEKLENAVKKHATNPVKNSTWQKIKSWAIPLFIIISLGGIIASSITYNPLFLLAAVPLVIGRHINSLEEDKILRTVECLYHCLRDLLSVPVIGDEEVRAFEQTTASIGKIENPKDFYQKLSYNLPYFNLVSKNSDELFELLENSVHKNSTPKKSEFGETTLKLINNLIKNEDVFWNEMDFSILLTSLKDYFKLIDDPTQILEAPKTPLDKKIRKELLKWFADCKGNSADERSQYFVSNPPELYQQNINRIKSTSRKHLILPEHYRRIIIAMMKAEPSLLNSEKMLELYSKSGKRIPASLFHQTFARSPVIHSPSTA